ncbi:tRNA (guanosine(46)-N7)-methyltransferase TrmB [Candidatus Thioglobus sp.]|jgi:tRNA (guanine-N7-)-methyltransferase|nr:tRNA (guanosine(46)-N7)-methyltransferase TrmB [Candidatus Thioglobus sp.]MDB9951464.1 tRNA (guanosine(46)-N7)-methyltransferase TrmB [Candidatus Thioglobus sp.]|tara:strand:- start:620 stop:1315 length:696 start_codon:yes stop_codon:yes gene_type:complete
MTEVKYLRKIQSFVRRSGRISKAQSIGLNELWHDYGVDLNEKKLDFNKLFLSKNNVTLEVGFGNGDSLLEMAIDQPNQNFLGIEVYEAGVGRLINEANKNKLSNLKIIKDDAVEVLTNNILDNSISHFQLFFPDPWHKKKHHKRRIVQISFLDLLSNKLKKDGIVHIATDWENYAEHIMELLESHSHFKNCAGDHMYSLRPKNRPLTKFENRGQKLGHGVWDIIFTNIKGG